MPRHLLAALLAALVSVPAIWLLAETSVFSSARPAGAQISEPARSRACDEHCSAKWMDVNLRLDQLQMVGSAESYKERPSGALMALLRLGGRRNAEALDFAMPSLEAQLDNDVRALQFDVAYDPKGGSYKSPAGAGMAMELLPDAYLRKMAKPGFKVIHVLDVDYGSSCLALADCLSRVAVWSKAHPRHLPIVIALTTNDDRTPMPGATKPVPCDEAAMNALDEEIRAAFGPDQLITPDQVEGKYENLRAAVLAHAWPKLAAARGKVIFVLDDSPPKIKAYQGSHKSLKGRAMFVVADENSPLASFLSLPDPLKENARIQRAVRAGFMVLTRADDETREARLDITARRQAAFTSGAQIVETDFVVPDPAIGSYRVNLADNPAAMCGVELRPEHCIRFEAPLQPLRTAVAGEP
jgi:hypothetical protein